MKGYNYYILNKDSLIIENKKRIYLNKIEEFYTFFNNLLNKKRFIKIEEYKKKIEYFNEAYLFLNQLKESNMLNEYLNYNEKLINLFLNFILDYVNINEDIINHNKKFQNKSNDVISNIKIAKNILILIKSLNKFYDKSVIINILKGNDLDNIKEMGLDKSKGFGRLKNINYQDIKHEMDELIKLHYLEYDNLKAVYISTNLYRDVDYFKELCKYLHSRNIELALSCS